MMIEVTNIMINDCNNSNMFYQFTIKKYTENDAHSQSVGKLFHCLQRTFGSVGYQQISGRRNEGRVVNTRAKGKGLAKARSCGKNCNRHVARKQGIFIHQTIFL